MKNQLLWLLSSACVGISPAIAHAQTGEIGPDPTSGNLAGEVIVTAQRRSERLLDVPMSISAISGTQLAASGVSSTGQLQLVTPGLLTINVGTSFTPAIRGVTSVGSSPGDETNIALYVDDVYIGASFAGVFEFKDIERIEVLKGPQGTLFGRNATGGAIRVVTLQPSFSPRGEASVDYGIVHNRLKSTAYVTGPISEKLAGSLALIHVNDDGYIKGIAQNIGKMYGRNYSISGRGKLLFRPTEDLSATLSLDISDQKTNGNFAWTPVAENFQLKDTPGAVLPRGFETSVSTQPQINLRTWGASMTAEYAPPDGISVKSITATRTARLSSQADQDRINLSLVALRAVQSQENFSQEFILSTPAAHMISFVGGLYYYYSKAWIPDFAVYTGDAPTGTITSNFTDTVRTNAYAAYGEIAFSPTERLHLTLGGRYTVEKKEIDYRSLVRAAGPVTASDSRTWRSPTYRAVIRYDLMDSANLYLSASNGFKSGVYNAYAYPLVSVAPEKINAYEIGAKGRFGGMTGTLAAFWYKYNNIQVQGQTQVGNTFIVTLTNAARAEIRGIEATLNGDVTDHVSFDIGGSWMPTAKYKSYPNAQVFVPQALGNRSVVPFDATGSRSIRSPRFQGNSRISYSNEFAGGNFDASLNYSFNSGYYYQPGNLTFQKSYSVLGGRIAWTDANGRFTYSVTGENLTNERYSYLASVSLLGTALVWSRSREVSFGIAAKF